MEKKLGEFIDLVLQHTKNPVLLLQKLARQIAGIIDAIDCRMGKKEAIPSGKVQGLLLEDLKRAEQEKSAADHQIASSSGVFSQALDEAVTPKESLGKEVECLQEEVREDSDQHSAQLQALVLISVMKIDNWTTKAIALEEQIWMLQDQLAAANEKLKGEKIFNPSINEGGSPPLSTELHEWSDYLKTSFIMEKPDERREASRTSDPGTKDAVVQAYLNIFNSGSKEELIRLHRIGEKTANIIIGLREESLKPFTSLDDLKKVGVSTKMIKKLLGL